MQREALTLPEQQLFYDKPFQFPPDLYNQLASSNWSHWGILRTSSRDIAVHDVILQYQDSAVSQLLSANTLNRLNDAELKIPADQDAFTTAELIERLTKAIFAEVDTLKEGDFTNRKPAISSLRRNLQRSYLRRLANLAISRGGAPDDCQTVAHAELASLNARIEQLLKSNVKLDSYSRAHLQESSSRIQKTLDDRITVTSP